MAKKLNSNDRRKLLEARGRGLSNSEIKRQLGITDDRTLRRHLELAEQEQEARTVKAEVLKEALRDHLAELRQLIESWKGVRIPSVTDLPSTMTAVDSLHSNRLFACLKRHLPFPTLWRDYNQWETKYRSYKNNCEKLREESRSEAVKRMKLDFAAGKFSHFVSVMRWMLGFVFVKLEGEDMKEVKFRWEDYEMSVKGDVLEGKRMFGYPRGEELLEIFNQPDIDTKFYEKECEALLNFCLSSETVANLSTLLGDLHDLEAKIHNYLEEILLRRDYILYTCKLCPGKPQLLR